MKTLSHAVAVAIALLIAPAAAQTLEADLQRAVQKEMVSGDVKTAIDEYRKIAARAGANRAVKAKALLRMADSYRKLGDGESRKLYEQVVKEFADQKQTAAEARTRLAASRAPAAGAGGQSARQMWTGNDVDAMGQVSADGRYLTYTDWNTGDLAVRDLTTGVNRPITHTGGWEASGDFAEFSVPSPDGREIAYAWYSEKPQSAAFYDLRLISTNGDGAKARIVHRADDIHWLMPYAWTPDGKHIVVYRERKGSVNELGVVTVATGAFRVLKELPHGPQRAGVSPDGRFVVYDAPPSANTLARDIFLINIDGSGHALIDASPSNDQMPMWTPDGSRVIFLSNRTGANALWSIPIGGGKATGAALMLKQDVGTFYPLGMTRSGAIPYFVGGDRLNSHTVRVTPDMVPVEPPQSLTDTFVNAHIGASWSPDGQSVAFYVFHGREAQGAGGLVVRTLKTGQEREIPLAIQLNRNAGPIRWFPDGNSVLVVSRDPALRSMGYHRVNLRTGAVDLLHRTNTRGAMAAVPVLSPDGRSIFYIERTPPSTSVFRFDLESRQRTVVSPIQAMTLAISPDGQTLAAVYTPDPGASRTSAIALLPVTTGEPRVLLRETWWDASRVNALSWTPDGRHLLFVRSDGKGQQFLWRIPVGGGKPEKTGVSVRGMLKAPQLHADGTRLLYSTRDFSENSVWVLENLLAAPAVKSGSNR
jgi:Tol biopolymer transport system component